VPARGNDRRSTGRRGIDTEAARLRETLRAPQTRQLPLVEEAMGRQALALLGRLHATCAAADDLEQATIESLTSNPPPTAGHLCAGPYIRHRHLASRLEGLDACGPLGKRGPGRDDSMTLVSWLGGIFSGIDLADLRDRFDPGH